MAKVITTRGIEFFIDELFKKSEKNITIISPYLQLSQNNYERLKTAKDKGVKITIVFGKSELRQETFNELKNLGSVYFYENLHAKIYYNEKIMIIGSMNLYNASSKNREIGVYISSSEDKDMFFNGKEEAEDIIRNSKLEYSFPSSEKNINPSLKEETPIENNIYGYCIHCGKIIILNPKKPLCSRCYELFSDEPYYGDDSPKIEKYCHGCGHSWNTFFDEPLCSNCNQKYRHLRFNAL